jgi:mevalonate kinase
MRMTRVVTATAPAKVILLGEHAVNRDEAALAVSVGLYATCTLTLPSLEEAAGLPEGYVFESSGEVQRSAVFTPAALRELTCLIDGWLDRQEYAAIATLVAEEFFVPAAYVLAAAGEALPPRLKILLRSEIPVAAGLGSGGAIFVSLAAALSHLLEPTPSPAQIARWAWRGDRLAHGGTASGLDTQTSLYGGVIRYTLASEAELLPCAPGLCLVIGHSGVCASTGEINARVRAWLAERPLRRHYFREIGLLVREAERCLREGDWPGLGLRLNLNQLILERIGVSCPELERLIDAALEAGAYGAKLSGSGGGGIMIALVDPSGVKAVQEAIARAGGLPIVAPLAVRGVTVSTTPA